MMMSGSKHWSAGPPRRDQAPSNIADKGNREEIKLLAKLEASVSDGQRMVERQTILLAELHAAGAITTEAAKSLARLEEAVQERRERLDAYLAKARAADEQPAENPD